MTITYKIKNIDNNEKDIEQAFSQYLIKIIQNSIISKLSQFKLNSYRDYIINTTSIEWLKRPSSVDMVSIISTICNNIKCRRSSYNHTYVIYIDSRLMPNTRNSINMIARFLDKGNERFPGMYIFSKSFTDCGDNISRYWDMFVWQELHRLAVSEVVIIK